MCISDFPHVYYVLHPSHPPLLNNRNNSCLRVQMMKLPTMYTIFCSLSQIQIFSPSLDYQDVLSLFSFNMRDKASRSCSTQIKLYKRSFIYYTRIVLLPFVSCVLYVHDNTSWLCPRLNVIIGCHKTYNICYYINGEV